MDWETVSASESRLWDLISQRALPGADHKRIDKRIWDLFGEDRAVLCTDLAGFTRQAAAFGLVHFLRVLHEKRELLAPVIVEHDGTLVATESDSLLVTFRGAEQAIACAVGMQLACKQSNVARSPEDQLLLCVGIGYGPILRAGNQAWGAELMAAQHLGQGRAEAHQVLVTGAAREAAAGAEPALEVEYLDLGVAVPGSAQNYRVKYV